MKTILSCYYIDDALDEEELQFVAQTLLGPWARFKTGATSLQQKRVPLVLPAPDADGAYGHDREYRADRIRNNLRHAGIRTDCGRQVVWVTPRDAEWDAIFQFAIRTETGHAPFVAQRWSVQDGVPVRCALRVIDTQMLLRGLM
ncbi:hypothetical protein D3870_18055 [Noviherbaspirillum cavernae]|uniref:Uncharacterized protein n=1 Tax=Noviherbaspirillum cavernae TaxID=2320862 RepID=A0A418X5H8_9BURK|nr:hypothetical protein [Noviherbaspirillum cavernae]RJG07646.1 hypothetical protein D3870_18055 [Noviherbaspirillum cavernae]